MTIEQAVLEQLRTLPPEAQQEALDFVEFLASRQPKATHSATLLEAASDLIGAIPDLPPDLSTNPSYLQSFGQS
ncbi:DUF2281 domain-containing protein [Leptolyngbya boryana CZ1]|uniref:DUF2281 domain-containing protein n=1 Tax=Leptolyngbya boryana CZ1 TaxID=3060204 RepID=A0AA96X074_LEPBY|nr:DUF2281 domain-containing protein [Leptolyngbya boryana]WNZ49141.1 DUF2281 domain-containing protein [Leptolyngbya boryana CZ1]